MPHTQWTLPPARPIVDRRPSAAQIVGLLLAGLIVGIAGALVGVNYADSQRQPDVFNESGPWVPVMPDVAGVPETTLHMNMEFSQLTTGCGEWDIAYVQDGVNLTFSNFPRTSSLLTGRGEGAYLVCLAARKHADVRTDRVLEHPEPNSHLQRG